MTGFAERGTGGRESLFAPERYGTKPASEIIVGDAILSLGEEHRVSELRPNEGPFEFILGYAVAADGWSICLENHARLEVAL